MAAHRHRWQVLLFLVALILPCVVLVVLGLRMVAQERELAEKRLAKASVRALTDVAWNPSSRAARIGSSRAA